MKNAKDAVTNMGVGWNLGYCILNVHHDTGADSNTFKSWLKASGNSFKANQQKYEYL